MKNGIDISLFQTGIDLNKAKCEGVEFVIIRAGIGTIMDKELVINTLKASAAELPYGFYWHSMALSVEEAVVEAKACIAAIEPFQPVFPVFYDMEEQTQMIELDTYTRTAIISVFCEELIKAGYMAGIYSNPSMLNDYLDRQLLLQKYPLWLAYYTFDPSAEIPYDYGQMFWQWGNFQLDGMTVDGDVLYEADDSATLKS